MSSVLPHSLCSVAPLYAHLEFQNVEFMQFAFRWMNCLLMREISVQNTIRMWDTYLVRSCALLTARIPVSHLLCYLKAEGPDAFSQFHLYVCSAFLVRWSEKLRQMDFQVRFSFFLVISLFMLTRISRASLCFSNLCRHKIGVIMRSRCF